MRSILKPYKKIKCLPNWTCLFKLIKGHNWILLFEHRRKFTADRSNSRQRANSKVKEKFYLLQQRIIHKEMLAYANLIVKSHTDAESKMNDNGFGASLWVLNYIIEFSTLNLMCNPFTLTENIRHYVFLFVFDLMLKQRERTPTNDLNTFWTRKWTQ